MGLPSYSYVVIGSRTSAGVCDCRGEQIAGRRSTAGAGFVSRRAKLGRYFDKRPEIIKVIPLRNLSNRGYFPEAQSQVASKLVAVAALQSFVAHNKRHCVKVVQEGKIQVPELKFTWTAGRGHRGNQGANRFAVYLFALPKVICSPRAGILPPRTPRFIEVISPQTGLQFSRAGAFPVPASPQVF